MLEKDLKATIAPRMAEIAHRLVDELPEDAAARRHDEYGEIAYEYAQARGIPYPMLSGEELTRAGADWHLFPNMVSCPPPTRCWPIALDRTASIGQSRFVNQGQSTFSPAIRAA